MKNMLIYPVGNTKACLFAAGFLQREGISLVDHPSPEVTHLLLDVPSFDAEGRLRDGGDLKLLLSMLPEEITIVGGNLCSFVPDTYHTVDLLQDPAYLARNAAITADCAVQVASSLLETTFADTTTLIIGWGRIGKCLGQMLKNLGCPVTVAARREADRAILRALGYEAVDIGEIPERIQTFRLIFNTAPEKVLEQDVLKQCRQCVKIDLASKQGLVDSDVVWARGLPGVYAPESSGKLIAESFLRLCREAGK